MNDATDCCYRVTIPITPRPTGRPRACIRGNHASTYKAAADVSHHDSMVAFLAAYPERPVSPITSAIQFSLGVYLPRPKLPKKRGTGPVPCDHRPDIDNLMKGVLDALTKAGWIKDDGQVTAAMVAKWWHEVDGVPRYEVVIEADQ